MKRAALFVICLISLQIFAQEVYVTRSGKAGFTSSAPLEVISAETGQMRGAIDLNERTFAFTIDNNSFKGFNSSLQQEHFYENYMETDLYPESSFKGKIIEEIDRTRKTEQVVRAKGILDIHGVKQERIIKGTLRIDGNNIFISAAFSVLLEDHQIKVPKVVNQKIAESIEVTISAQLIRDSD